MDASVSMCRLRESAYRLMSSIELWSGSIFGRTYGPRLQCCFVSTVSAMFDMCLLFSLGYVSLYSCLLVCAMILWILKGLFDLRRILCFTCLVKNNENG